MKLERLIEKILSRPLDSGLLFKMRNAPAHGLSWKNAFARAKEVSVPKAHEKILVVGLGVAAHTFCHRLKELGYSKVTILSKDDLYGGKCVNLGCMPSEFFGHHKHLPPAERLKATREFSEKLKDAVGSSWKSLGYPLKGGELKAIEGKEVVLAHGERLSFDRLVLAMGNSQRVPPVLGSVMPLSEFWREVKSEYVIVSDSYPGALSFADVALQLGSKATVLYTSKVLLGNLPSVQFFRSQIEKRGAKVIEEVELVSRTEDKLTYKKSGKTHEVSFGGLLYAGHPMPNLPAPFSAETVDFRTSTLVERPDIFLLGDAAGLLSAAEAELQAWMLAESWAGGEPRTARVLQDLPFRLHGEQSIAAVGHPSTLLMGSWEVIDFSSLGWSMLSGESGKLWYRFDSKSRRVEAIHICHPRSMELIAMAAALLDKPIEDPLWITCTTHPSPGEIFKVLVTEIQKKWPMKKREVPKVVSLPAPSKLVLPKLQGLRTNPAFSTFSPKELREAEMDTSPDVYLSVVMGLRSLGYRQDVQKADGKYVCEVPDFFYAVEKGMIQVHAGDKDARVFLEA